MSYPMDACKIYDANDIQRIATACGNFYFSPDAMRYFRSRVSGFIARESNYSGLFVTSEQQARPYDSPEPRRYTVRSYSVTPDSDDMGVMTIGTVGDFQGFDTLRAAQAYARSIAKHWQYR